MGAAVVACVDAPPVLEPTEAPLDNIAALIGVFVVADFLFAVGFAGNDRLDALLFEEGADRIRIVTLVGKQFLDAGKKADGPVANIFAFTKW